MTVTALLRICGLTVQVPVENQLVRIVDGVSLEIQGQEILGLVGENGSGKSTVCSAVLGLLPRYAKISGKISVNGRDVTRATEQEMRLMRGREASIVFQDPMQSLNPVRTIGGQIVEKLTAHRRMDQRQAARESAILLERVRIPAPDRCLKAYPHELSRGMNQRAMIALALASNPKLLIADEPTASLDSSVQRQILDLLCSLTSEMNMGLLIVSHDLALISAFATRVAVMYAGRIVEKGSSGTLFSSAQHPYTQGLIEASPKIDRDLQRMQAIPGGPPEASQSPSGCAFGPRCRRFQSTCATDIPALRTVTPGHSAACIFAGIRE